LEDSYQLSSERTNQRYLLKLPLQLSVSLDTLVEVLHVSLFKKKVYCYPDLIPRYRTLSPQARLARLVRDKVISLYSQILKYQIYVFRQYSRAGFFRFLRDVVVADNWKEMLKALKETESAIRRNLTELDTNVLRQVNIEVSKLQEKANEILSGLDEIRSEVEVFYHWLS
jgi:hypothetical protein